MTENISERIDNAIKDIEKIQIMFRQKYGEECLADKEIAEVLKIAKAEHEELEKYRSIGTVEEMQELKQLHDEHREDITVDLAEYRDLCKIEEIPHMKSLKQIIKRNGTIGKALDECAKYEEIGTVEECREAVERQRTKKPVARNEDRKIYMCHCGNTQITTMDNFCRICGQAISWEESEGEDD